MKILTLSDLTEANLGKLFLASQRLREYLVNNYGCTNGIAIELIGLSRKSQEKAETIQAGQSIKLNGNFYELKAGQSITIVIPESPLRLKVIQQKKRGVTITKIVSLSIEETNRYLGNEAVKATPYGKDYVNWIELDKAGAFGRRWNETTGEFEDIMPGNESKGIFEVL